MLRFRTIAANAFMELVRQPVFLLIMTVAACFSIFLSSIPYFAFGDDVAMVKSSTLAVTFVAGLFGAVMSASASVAHEIRSGTALAVLAKPVGKAQFLMAKFVGLAGALAVLTYVNTLAALMASRMGYDVYGETDWLGLGVFFFGIAIAYAAAGLSNYFLRRPFVPDAVYAVILVITIVFAYMAFLAPEHKNIFDGATGIDWRMIPAAILILFALWILSGLALACSTRLELIPTLSICTIVFLVGLMSDYWFGRAAAEQGSFLAHVLYTIVPNWQLFWISDALAYGKPFPWTYVGKAFLYVLCYLGASLAVALALFEDRELT